MKNSKNLALYILGVVAVLALPIFLQSQGNAWVRIADIALLYVMLALGLNIVVGYAGLLDLGYVAFYGIGAYAYAILDSDRRESAAALPQVRKLREIETDWLGRCALSPS